MSEEPQTIRKRLTIALLEKVIGYCIIAAVFPIGFWLVTQPVWVTQVPGDGETLYRWSFLADFGILLAVLAFLPVAWLVRKRETLLGCLLLLVLFPAIIGLTMGFLAVFMPHKYEVSVSTDQFDVRKGGFGEPERQTFRFHDLKEIRLGNEWKVLDRRGFVMPFRDSYLEVVFRDGQTQNVVVGRLVEAALPDLVERAQGQGVPIIYVDR